ncbi:MAG: GNAT family N-acetyltransferase [Oscillospiraceae bacterium]|nr:GNAT family N-acetyltransferase [Oscillospiraceae bacterium]
MQDGTCSIRHAEAFDLDAVTALEARCFPPSEAASPDAFAMRLRAFPQCLWLLEEDGRIVSMIGGMTSEAADLCDAMYEGTSLYEERGAWLMIFGVATDPDRQHRGLASQLMRYVIAQMQSQRRDGLVLTCKEALVPFYRQFGFVNEGRSASVHGGACWYQMRLCLPAGLERCILRGEECRFRHGGRDCLLYGWEQCDGYVLNVQDDTGALLWQSAPMRQEACAAAFREFLDHSQGGSR